MKNYVYIIKCADGTLYTGWTNNLDERILAHNSGTGAKYTRGRLPVKLIYSESFSDKSSAMKRECEIKKMTKAKKEDLICPRSLSKKGYNYNGKLKG